MEPALLRAPQPTRDMTPILIAAGVLALLLTIYLFVALFKPEAFE